MKEIQTISFHTLGCKLNFAESSSLANQLKTLGYDVVPFDQPADCYVINTCSVTEFADRKCRKAVKSAKKKNQDAKVIMIGCYAQLQPEEIRDIDGVDLVLGAKDKFQLIHHIKQLNQSEYHWVSDHSLEDLLEFEEAYSFEQRTRSFLKIQDGCDYKCSFCTIPKARGSSRSNTIEKVVKDVDHLVSLGAKEIVLTGVNIGDFGKSAGGGEDFLELIQTLDRVDYDVRYRISSIEPNLCSSEIIRFVAESRHFMPHFHMPLQSGSNDILKAMRRRYRRELYEDRVREIRRYLPSACIGVDVIVGFPGETVSHFIETYDFLSRLDVSYLHVFTYSARPNTRAASFEDQVDLGERRNRNRKLRELSNFKKYRFYLRHQGQQKKVLLETSNEPDYLNGFTDNYIKIRVEKGSLQPNQQINVQLNNVRQDGLVMEALEV